MTGLVQNTFLSTIFDRQANHLHGKALVIIEGHILKLPVPKIHSASDV